MTTDRIHNFSAGPATLPEDVLRNVQRDVWNIDGSGVGIMEHSHRGKVFDRVLEEAESNCRTLASIPDDYRVLFLQGGASTQFFMTAANFLTEGRTADYINTGSWSKKAIKEAKRYGGVHIAASSEEDGFTYVPRQSELTISDDPAYLHFTSNNTIYGTQFGEEPIGPDGVPLICDASSDIFSKPIDVTKYDLIYAGAQKNLGPSGAVLVIVRDRLLERANTDLPSMLQYGVHAKGGSRYNTPPAFGIYVMGEVFKWIMEHGGLSAMGKRNEEKAALIYDEIDRSPFWTPVAREDSRSQMNVCFRGPNEELEAKFVAEAEAQGLSGLKAHRSTGGMRASIYNAFKPEGCEALVEFMKGFEGRNG